MSTESELRAAYLGKMKISLKKLQDTVTASNERMTRVHYKAMNESFRLFEEAHIQYLHKSKKSFEDESEKAIFEEASDLLDKAEDVCGDFLDQLEAAKKREEAARAREAEAAQGRIIQSKRKVKLCNEMELLVDAAKTRVNVIQSDVLPDPAAVRHDLTELESELNKLKILFNEYEENSENATDLAEVRSNFWEAEQKFKMEVLSIRSFIETHQASSVRSRTHSPSIESNGSNPFRYKKMDFPKFSGSIRQYAVFKRDFKEMLQDTGYYNDKQLGHVIRNECLSGDAQKLVRNLYKIEDIWKKLDDKYEDQSEVIELITKEITGLKKVEDDDYNSFIGLVNIVEQAAMDLGQMDQSSVLSNPVTVRLILSKCPKNVQEGLMRELCGKKQSEEFDTLLQFLLPRRKDAIRLARVSEFKPAPKIQNPVKKKVNSVNVVQEVKKKSSQKNTWKCITEGCTFTRRHYLSECRAFKKLSADDKGKLVLKEKLCLLCFNREHEAKDCPMKKAGWKECDVDGCQKWHNRWLHGAQVPGLTLTVSTTVKGAGADELETLLLIQEVPVEDQSCLVFWDHGSTTSLVTFAFAEKCGLEGVKCLLELTGVGEKVSVIKSKLYIIPLRTKGGDIKHIKAFGMESITSDMVKVKVKDAAKEFGIPPEDVERPTGQVDLLVGLDSVDILPIQCKVVEKLALYESIFGTGKILGGKHASIKKVGKNLAHTVYRVTCRSVKLPDFLTTEGFGIDLPRRCKNCKGCKDCSFRARQLTWIENQELAEIEKNLTLNLDEKRWHVQYPFKEDPSTIRNNYNQAYACLTSLEKRLQKQGQWEKFEEQFDDAVKRGVFVKLSQYEIENYSGPVNYVTLTEAFKDGDQVTTPVRLCMNSSMKYGGVSLNDLLMKGPSSLNDIFNVMLNFRKYEVGFVKDISKFYQSIIASEQDQHLRRVLWRSGQNDKQPDVYVTTTVNFGDRPAGCISLTALRMTADLYKDLDPEAAEKLKKDNYVDDLLSGAENKEKALYISEKMEEIAECGGFKFKSTCMSGDALNDDDENKMKILGTLWNPMEDTLQVEVKVNPSPKRKGAKSAPDIEFEKLSEKMPEKLSKRVVWRIVLGQFDLLGMLSVFLVKLKLIMRELCSDQGKKLGWDEDVDEQTRKKLMEILMLMGDARKITFPRCFKPENTDPDVKPVLIMFGDGSTQAFCTLAYGRWKLKDGSYKCRLISGKTRVAPLRKISVPRMELLGAVAAVRLANSIHEATGIEFEKRYFFTDSSAVLGMIKNESAAFQEFVGTRTGEIRSKSDPNSEWFWIPTDENLADLGTRENVLPDELGIGTDYQNGRPWMSMDMNEWPCKKEFGTPPPEELKKSAQVGATSVQLKHGVFVLSRFSSYNMLVSAAVIVLRCCHLFLKRPKEDDVKKERTEAENWLFVLMQSQVKDDMKAGKLASLFPRLKEVMIFGRKFEIVVTSGRIGGGLAIGYDKDELPILYPTCRFSKLLMKHAHEFEHCGSDRTLQRSRNFAWIIRGRRLAKSVKFDCFKCRLRHKKLEEQLIAPLPSSRLPPAPVFYSTAVDLFGPIAIKDTVKGRCKRNGWGVLFCCTVTSAIHLEVSEDYSCDSFLLCLKRFMNLRGTPSRIQSDPGSQLVAASKEVEKWNYERITEWSNKYKITWYFTPTDSQHYNGVAEAMIKVTKKQLNDVIKSRTLTKGELDTLFSDVMFIVNSRPLMKSAGDDTLSGNPITPLHLLGGRATLNVPSLEFDGRASLTKRLRFLEEIKDEFWRKWFSQVFPNLVPCYKWRTKHRDVQIGDIVLVKDANLLRNEYRLARVGDVITGDDGHVRRVKLLYKILDDGRTLPAEAAEDLKKAKFQETERSVQNIVVIVPSDWKEQDIEDAVLEDLKVNRVD